jgi:hypothetical protein
VIRNGKPPKITISIEATYNDDFVDNAHAKRLTKYGTLRSWYKWKECNGHLKHAREKCK